MLNVRRSISAVPLRSPAAATALWIGTLALAMLAVLAASTAAAQAPTASVLGLDSLLETRVSTAAKYSQRVSEVAGSITIVTSDDIERYGYRTLDQVLASVPGFYISNDRSYTYVGARGFSRPSDYNNRILLLIDGSPMNEGVSGAAPLSSNLAISLHALERIEIVRGPGSALYGTGAVFGVINLITKTAATMDGAQVAVTGGSYGERGVEAMYGRRFSNGLGVVLSGIMERSDGQDLFYPEFNAPATNDGVAHDLDWEQRWGLLGSVTLGNFRLHGRHVERDKAIPTAAHGMVFNAPGAAIWAAFSGLELNYDQDFGAGRHLATRAYYNHNDYSGKYTYPDSTGEAGILTGTTNNKVLGGEATFRWDLSSSNRLTVGGELKRNVEARFYIPGAFDLEGASTGASAYIQNEHQFSRVVSLLAGLRYDGNTISKSSLTPRAALLLRPTEATTVKLLYGGAFRAPNVIESGIGYGPYLKNPNLVPERARTLELVWQQRMGASVLWSTSLFRYQMRGLIETSVDSATSLIQYRNAGDANSSGVETGFDARLGRSVTGFANYTYQHTVDQATDNRLTNSPAHLLKGGLSLDATSWLRPGVVLRYESSRKTVFGTSTDAYFITDLNLGILGRRDAPGPRLEMGLRLNNLFNVRYASPGGFEHRQLAIPQDGRNVTAEIRYGF